MIHPTKEIKLHIVIVKALWLWKLCNCGSFVIVEALQLWKLCNCGNLVIVEAFYPPLWKIAQQNQDCPARTRLPNRNKIAQRLKNKIAQALRSDGKSSPLKQTSSGCLQYFYHKDDLFRGYIYTIVWIREIQKIDLMQDQKKSFKNCWFK